MDTKISVRNLWKTYPTWQGPLAVLAGLDFTVASSEFVALVGPSGCGKTTLLHILAGFERPDRGEVSVDAIPVTEPGPKSIVISQQGSVFPWLTVRQNLMFGVHGLAKSARRRLADHYVAMVGLQGFERAFPFQLSGGMLQRVEMARALIVKPEILYMDEPLGGLDALLRLRLRRELQRILSTERHTTLLVTHDVEEAIQLADRIFVLSPRPMRIQSVKTVPFPHPRKVSSPEVVELKEEILRELGIEQDIVFDIVQ